MNNVIARFSSLAAAALIAIAALPAAAFCADNATAESVQLISMRNKKFGTLPRTVTVRKGTTLVWYNKDPEPVVVEFMERMEPTCDAPVNFHEGLKGTFISGIIPQSGIAGMCIVMPGTYHYKVERRLSQPGQEPVTELTKGMIIVQ